MRSRVRAYACVCVRVYARARARVCAYVCCGSSEGLLALGLRPLKENSVSGFVEGGGEEEGGT